MASDLSSIPGLLPKHEAVLTGPLLIKTAADLARADRRVVYAAMRRLRPALTPETIAAWQDHARDLAGAPSDPAGPSSLSSRARPAGPAGWEQVAAFVVSFETRQTTAEPERRLIVEQAELAPPEPRQEWPDWSREAAWTWMLDRTKVKDGGDPQPTPIREAPREKQAASDRPGRRSVSDAAQGPATQTTGRSRRVPRAIRSSTPELVLPAGTIRRLDAASPSVDIPPRAVLRVTPTCAPQLELLVSLRLRRSGAPSYAPSPPVTVVSGEAAELDLGGLPPGEHAGVLTIWASAGAAAAAVIPLPRLCVPV